MNEKTLAIIIKAQDQASKTISGIGDVASKVGDAFVKMAKVAAVAGAAAAAAFTVSAIKNAIDLSESINAVEKTFGDASGKILEFGKTAASVAGLSMAQFNTAVVPIGAMLQNMGFQADQAAESSIELGKRAADLASVFNTSLDDALTAIQAGLRGEADPLERFGVGLSQTNVKAYALAQGIIKTGEEMTTAQQATARLGLLLSQTERFAGDFVDTADQAANKARILAANFDNQSVVIGQQLLPAWEMILDVANKLVTVGFPLLSQGITTVKNLFAEWWPRIVEVATAVGDYLAPKLATLGTVIQERVIPLLLELWHNVIEPLLPVIGQLLVGAIGAVIDIIANLLTFVADMIQAFRDGNPVVVALAAVFAGLATAMAFNAIFSALSAGFTLLTTVTIPAVAATVGGLRALISSPIAFGAIAVAAALAALYLIEQAADRARKAIDQAQAANQAEADTSIKLIRQNKANYDAGKIDQTEFLRLNKIYARADGGSVSAGTPYLVGENRDGSINKTTELFVPSQSGSIVNSKDLQSMLNGGGGGSTINFHGNIMLGSADAVDRMFERLGKVKELGELGVGL